MKAFKKWWNSLLCSNNENFRIIAESSWRAALDEILNQVETSNSDGSIIQWIGDELKE